MNRINAITVFALFVVGGTIIAPGARSQSLYNPSYREEGAQRKEHIVLLTDRTMYAVNENIRFRAFARTEGSRDEATGSRVLYVELVTPSGTSVSKGKYPLDESGAGGSLEIPADALTGNYWIRSYTRWMRNSGPLTFAWVPLKIINPGNPDILPDESEGATSPSKDLSMSHEGLFCRTGKAVYAPHETVTVEIGRNGNTTGKGEYCLTVVPAGLADTVFAGTGQGQGEEAFEFRFLPDVRGISISGSVRTKEDGAACPAARIHFSLLGDDPMYFGTLTDKQGRFCLALPERTGMQELFVACEYAGGDRETEVLIDRDFATGPVPFGNTPFRLSPAEKKAAARMALNMQLREAFLNRTNEADTLAGKPGDLPFYGKPSFSIRTADFVQLPNMREVFDNLVPAVFVHFRHGRPYLKIESGNSNIAYYPPLLLIDRIPVFDQKAFLDLDPARISRIDIVDEVYVKGSMVYGGIISLTSTAGDMAAIDLPEGSYFFDYGAFHHEVPEVTAAGETEPSGMGKGSGAIRPGSGRVVNTPAAGEDDRIPDTRNTLLWMDRIVLEGSGTGTVRFGAAGDPGTYTVLLRGTSGTGEVVCGTASFRVKEAGRIGGPSRDPQRN